VIKKMAHRVFEKFGIHDVDIEVTFPEVVTHNRNEKIKDIVTAKVAGVLSQERAANMISKELQISDFDWTLEQKKIEVEKSKGENGTPTPEEEINPLTAVPKLAQNKPSATTSGINNSDKASAEKNRGF
jgi:molybdenum cofactor biosynthesis enzyme